MNSTKLYHCTDFESLCNILKSSAYWPSFCLEKADYLDEPQEFAFAMVCFADLLVTEVKPHLKKFNKQCYLQMSKDWAKRRGLSNVIYYNKPSVVSVLFKHMINDIIERTDPTKEMSNEVRFTSMMMAYFKQYEGSYWNDIESCWSPNTTQFYTEREWRYVPLPQNGEAFYLDPDEFRNKKFRNERRKELIDNGYLLRFNWYDIEKIGVHSFKQWIEICNYYTNGLKYNPVEVMKKVKIIF